MIGRGRYPPTQPTQKIHIVILLSFHEDQVVRDDLELPWVQEDLVVLLVRCLQDLRFLSVPTVLVALVVDIPLVHTVLRVLLVLSLLVYLVFLYNLVDRMVLGPRVVLVDLRDLADLKDTVLLDLLSLGVLGVLGPRKDLFSHVVLRDHTYLSFPFTLYHEDQQVHSPQKVRESQGVLVDREDLTLFLHFYPKVLSVRSFHYLQKALFTLVNRVVQGFREDPLLPVFRNLSVLDDLGVRSVPKVLVFQRDPEVLIDPGVPEDRNPLVRTVRTSLFLLDDRKDPQVHGFPLFPVVQKDPSVQTDLGDPYTLGFLVFRRAHRYQRVRDFHSVPVDPDVLWDPDSHFPQGDPVYLLVPWVLLVQSYQDSHWVPMVQVFH